MRLFSPPNFPNASCLQDTASLRVILLVSVGLWFFFQPAEAQSSPNKVAQPSKQAKERERLWTRVWSRKVATWKRTSKRFRSSRCWRMWRDLRRDGGRQEFLLRKMVAWRCNRKTWKRCQRRRGRRWAKLCRSTRQKKRWSACFRIERRLSVITERLLEAKRDGRRYKCGWVVKIPDRFRRVFFAPYPKLSKVEKAR